MTNALRVKEWYRVIERVSILGFVLVGLLVLLSSPAHLSPVPNQDGDIEPLQALASVMPNQGWAPLTVYFNAFGSSAVDGEIIEYRWDLDGNGRFDTDATAEDGYTNYTYAVPGDYVVTLEIVDSNGHVASASVTIQVRHPASSSVDYWTIFDDTEVRRVDLLVSQQNWDQLWADPIAKVRVNADVIVFGERFNDVSLRMRGHFSLSEAGAKKPWAIDFDAYAEGQEYHNLKQLLFTNNIGDASMLQATLAFDMMRFAGVPASHINFVEIWVDITDDNAAPLYLGVYNMIERVDRKFLGNRFGQDNDDGNLYQATHALRGPMDLVYYGDRIEDYPTQNGLYSFGKETNEEEADYSDIIQLCYVIDGVDYATPEDFAQALEPVFNVDGFLRYMAVVITLSNWDIYPYTGNNYFLYHNPGTGQFEWIPWDLSWGLGERTDQPLFELSGHRLSPYAPLYERVFAVERYRRQFAAYVDLLSRTWFTYPNVYHLAQTYHDLIAPYVVQSTGDQMYFGDTAWFTLQQFDDSWIGLANMAAERSAYIQTILQNYRD